MVEAGVDLEVAAGQSTTLQATITGGRAPVTCRWFTSRAMVSALCANVQVSPAETTTYAVTATDAQGGSATDLVTVRVVDALMAQAVASASSVAAGEAVALRATITGGRAPFTCGWSAAGSALAGDCDGAVADVQVTTGFTVTVTDAAQRTATATVTVSVHPRLTVVPGDDVTVVSGDSATLTATVSGGAAPVTCTWEADGVLVNGDCTMATVSPAQDTIYTLVARDAAGSTAVGAVLVHVVAPLEVTLLQGVVQVVTGEQAYLLPNIVGGQAPFSCAWTRDGMPAGTSCNLGVVATSSASYVLRVTDVAARTASVTGEVRVFTVSLPAAVQRTRGEAFPLSAGVSGGVGTPSCTWSAVGGGIIAGGDTCTVTLRMQDSDDVLVTVTDTMTGRVGAAGTHVTLLAEACNDGIHNGAETDTDCGGRPVRRWLNEVAFIGTVGELGVVAGVLMELLEDPLLGSNSATHVPFHYHFNDAQSAYEYQAPAVFPAAGGAVARCDPQPGDSRYTTCVLTAQLDERMALGVRDAAGDVIAFVRGPGGPELPAAGGPADGKIPAPLGVAVASSPSSVTITASTCLQGVGSTYQDFQWVTPCTSSFGPPSSLGVANPNQQLTGFVEDCPRCGLGGACVSMADCAPAMVCGPAMTCTP